MTVHEELDSLADGSAHGLHTLHPRPPGRARSAAGLVRRADLIEGGQLDGRKALGYGLPRRHGKAVRRALPHVTVDVCVQAQALPQRPAQQGAYGDAQRLPEDVPQSLFDSAHGGVGDAAVVAPRQAGPDGLYLSRVAAC